MDMGKIVFLLESGQIAAERVWGHAAATLTGEDIGRIGPPVTAGQTGFQLPHPILTKQIHGFFGQLDRPLGSCFGSGFIHTPLWSIQQCGILYLSMIRDLYDNSIVAHKTGTNQSVNLVLDTIRMAMVKEKVAAELQLHSDQGSQYTSQAYFELTKEYGITPSMSRRGNCYDNAMAENFFSILKTECIYRHRPKTFEEANHLIDNYIYFYNHQRIQLKTGEAPLTLRLSA